MEILAVREEEMLEADSRLYKKPNADSNPILLLNYYNESDSLSEPDDFDQWVEPMERHHYE